MQKRGVSTQVQVDAARTALDVAERTLDAMQSDRDVILQQMKEGAVLAPSAGRILKAPMQEGSVVLPGETIATLAEDRYILRLQLPERHARFMRAGDVVQIGPRGLEDTGERREGKVRIVYPEIEGGRVIADVEVPGLGDYFVGERTRVYVSTGTRKAVVVPRAYVYRRAGVDYVKLADGGEVVVQIGESTAPPGWRSSPASRTATGWFSHEARTSQDCSPAPSSIRRSLLCCCWRPSSPARWRLPRCRARRSRRSASPWWTSSSRPTVTRPTRRSSW